MTVNALSQTRQDVVDTLIAAGLNAFAVIPDRVAPPLVGVTSGNPYVEDGITSTNVLVRLTVRVIALAGTAETASVNIDDMVIKVINALRADQWLVIVNEPGIVTFGNADYPATDITITNYIETN